MSLSPGQTSGLNAEFSKGTEAMRNGDLDQAASIFSSITEKNPAFAEAYFNLGLVREQQGDFDSAIDSLQKAIKIKPHLHGANLFLGICQFRINALNAAATAVARETTNYPNDAAAWMWLGVVRLAQDHPEDAAEALDKAAKLKPGDPDILYHRGRAHLLVSKDSYAEMFKRDPNSWLVHRVMAQANAEADRHVEAIAEYEMAIKLAPTQPGLHEELGTEYRAVNKIPEAETAFRKELDLDPHNALARYKLGAIEVEKGDGPQAKDLIEAAQKEKPNLTHIDYNLGRAEMLVGDAESAARHFEHSVKTDADPEVIEQSWYQLGIAYRRLQRMDDARNAMATYQQIKDELARKSQAQLDNYRATHPDASTVPSADDHP
ncbi:MAG TPA: tetratricopeptide repeat protein [Terriglobales bacterium]|nr:tetratricopeptide repeat protein [Terriglobales bacterium]